MESSQRSERGSEKPLTRGDLRAKLIIISLLIALVVLNTTGWVVYLFTKNSFEREVGRNLSSLANLATRNIRVDYLPLIAPGDERLYPYTVLRNALEKVKVDSQLKSIFVMDLTNHILVDARKDIPIGTPCDILMVGEEDLAVVRGGRPVFTPPYRSPSDGRSYSAAYAPVRDNQGVVVGILGVEEQVRMVGAIGELRKRLFWIGFISLLLVAVLGVALTQSVVGPMRLLALSLSTERRYTQYILRSMASGLVSVNLDGQVTVFNEAAQGMLGLAAAEVVGRKVRDALHAQPELVELLEEGLRASRSSTSAEREMRGRHAQVVTIGIEVSVLRDDRQRAIGASAILVDLTETRRLQRQVQLKERLAAMGELSAGMAHEIRNPLEGIQLFTELLERKLDRESDRELTKKIQEEVKNLNKLVGEFLQFARPPRLELQDVDVRGVLEEAAALAEPRNRNGARIVSAYEDVPRVRVDPSQMKSVFLNIILNGLDAVSGGGQVGLAVRMGVSRYAPRQGSANGMVEVEISNTGPPIPAEYLDKIFNPFFTTRQKGTGLGLAIVHRIVSEHNGEVWVESDAREGTKFHVLLPVGGMPGSRVVAGGSLSESGSGPASGGEGV